MQFVNFTEQAQLCDRHLSLDQRHALDNEPCERCRLRGGRCARCKALRTGGGYIILDGGELSEDELKRKFVKSKFTACTARNKIMEVVYEIHAQRTHT